MTKKTVVMTEIIAPYRIPVFNALAVHPGIDLHTIFLAETDPQLRQWDIYKEEIRFSYEVLKSWRVRAGGRNFLVNRGVSAVLDRISPRVIICGGYNYLASWQALRWAHRRAVDFVLWSESNGQDMRPGWTVVEALKRHFINACTRFVVPGKAASQYLQSFGVPEAKIATAPNAVDNGRFFAGAGRGSANAEATRRRFSLPERFVLFVGRLVPEKGVYELLDAYAKLDAELRSRVGLVFAGDGRSKDDLVQRSESVAPGKICFAGFAQREDLAGLYGLAEALILPTHTDTWGLVVNEAMACQLPVIVTRAAGCSADLVENGWNGYVVPPRDSGELSAALASLLLQPDLRRMMGARSRERIRNYSPEICADGLACAALGRVTEKR